MRRFHNLLVLFNPAVDRVRSIENEKQRNQSQAPFSKTSRQPSYTGIKLKINKFAVSKLGAQNNAMGNDRVILLN